MHSIVLDKSFLQGVAGVSVEKLAASKRLLMSDALLYELVTTEPAIRARCFAKLPRGRNPVDLVSHVGTLMRRELDTGCPSGPPSANQEHLSFEFTEALLTEDYQPPGDARQAIRDEKQRIANSVDGFLERAVQTKSIFPDLLNGSEADRANARREAERALVEPDALQEFLSMLEPPPGEDPLPIDGELSDNWAIYRWVQVQLLFGLDVYVRYQGNIPLPLTPNVFRRMEHDVLDAELLILGCLEGAFATRENKLKRWWELLCPSGYLYQ